MQGFGGKPGIPPPPHQMWHITNSDVGYKNGRTSPCKLNILYENVYVHVQYMVTQFITSSTVHVHCTCRIYSFYMYMYMYFMV